MNDPDSDSESNSDPYRRHSFSSFSGVHPATIASDNSAVVHLFLEPPPTQPENPSGNPHISPILFVPATKKPPPTRLFAILFLETFPNESTLPIVSLISLHQTLQTANGAAVAFWRAWPERELLGGRWEDMREEEGFGRFSACGSVGGRWCAVRGVERGVEAWSEVGKGVEEGREGARFIEI